MSGEKEFWNGMTPRVGAKRTDKVMIGNVDDNGTNFEDRSELLKPLVKDDFPESITEPIAAAQKKANEAIPSSEKTDNPNDSDESKVVTVKGVKLIYEDVEVLKNKIDFAVTIGSSILTKEGFIQKTGTEGTNDSFSKSDFIDITNIDKIKLTIRHGSSVGGAFYTENEVYISGFDGNDFGTSDVLSVEVINRPTTAKYVKVSLSNDYLDDFFLQKGSFSDYGKVTDDVQADNTLPISSKGVKVESTKIRTESKQKKYAIGLNQSVMSVDGYILKNGDEDDNSGFKKSGFISLKEATEIELTVQGSSGVGGCFYDSKYNYISGFDGNDFSAVSELTSVTIDRPINAEYLKTSISNAFLDENFYISMYNHYDLSVQKNKDAYANSSILTEVGFILANGNVTDDNASFSMSGKIYLQGVSAIRMTIQGNSGVGTAFFDSEDNYVDGFDGNDYSDVSELTEIKVEVPSGALYMITSISNAFISNKYYISKLNFEDIGKPLSVSQSYDFNISDRNLTTFIGATNTVIDALLAVKPDAIFVFISNYTEDISANINGQTFDGNGKVVIDMQRLVANYWCADFLDLSRKLRMINRGGQDILGEFVPDNTHPGGDNANGYRLVNLISRYCKQFLEPLFDDWVGKRIAWYGTSIPAGNPYESNSLAQYPLQTANLLGATCDNYAQSSSTMRLYKVDGTENSVNRPHFTDTNNTTANYITHMVDLIGTANEPDIFVFDHGRNDFVDDPTDFNVSLWEDKYND